MSAAEGTTTEPGTAKHSKISLANCKNDPTGTKMESIRIQNLKSIKDSGEITIKPITTLVGKNSSGKSSIIRCLPLFKQSAESKTLGTVLWSGKYVDYGSFDEALRKSTESEETKDITFSFQFRAHTESHRTKSQTREEPLTRITISITGDEYNRNSHTDITYELHGNKISFRTNPDLKIISATINGSDFTKQVNEIYKAFKLYTVIPVLFQTTRGNSTNDTHVQALKKEIKAIVYHLTSDERILRIAKSLKFDNDEGIKRQLTSKNLMGERAAKKTANWTADDQRFKSIKDQIIFLNLSRITDSVADSFSAYITSTRYITPLRAAADRYYRIQNISIEELDPNGSNLAMFLKAKRPGEIEEINNWLKEEIGFTIEVVGTHGHASILIIDSDGKSKTNIADNGFGISQILPVLIQIWQQSKSKSLHYGFLEVPAMIVIEQPELHLHPKMQSRVGEMFCKAIRLARTKQIDLRIIIETHSKEIIDSIGKSIENGIISNEDAGVYLVDKDSENNVVRANFDQGGFLEKWPYGFFDGI